MKEKWTKNLESSRREKVPWRRTIAGKAKGRQFEGMRTVADSKEGEQSPRRLRVTNSKKCERSPIWRKANSRREGGGSSVWRNANGHRFEGRRTVADLKEGERSSGRWTVADSKECEWSPIRRKANGHREVEGSSVRFGVGIGDLEFLFATASWSVTVEHNQRQLALNGASSAMVWASSATAELNRWRWKLSGDSGSSVATMGALCFFFFFFLTEMANCVEMSFNLCLWLLVFFGAFAGYWN